MLENKVYVLDNIFSKEYPLHLQDIFFNKVSWDLSVKNTITDENNNLPKFYNSNHNFLDKVFDKPQMNHLLYQGNSIYSSYYYEVLNIILKFQEYFGYKFLISPLQIKANLKHQISNTYKDKFNPPHTDIVSDNLEHYKNKWTLIYYIISSDGDTIIFNEKFNFNQLANNYTINQQISPKQGRLIAFPTQFFHSGSFPCFNPLRMVLNINIEIFPI